jgi:hypothetical protein
MPITLLSAVVVAPNEVRLNFSEPYVADSDFYLPNNYAFKTRYGDDVPLYAGSVCIYSASSACVDLRDAMLQSGHYSITVLNIKGADKIKIQDGPGPNTFNFSGIGDPMAVFALRKRTPAWWNTAYGSNFYGVLAAVGRAIDQVGGKTGSGVAELVDAIRIRTATGADLDTIGQNYGVSRPEFAISNDALYRELIPILTASKKSILQIFYDVLTLIIGDQLVYGWAIYTLRPEELTIELPYDVYFGLGAGTLESATYFHADATALFPPSYPGDYFLADATVVGTQVDGNVVLLFQRTIIEDITSVIKASGIKITVVTT